MPSEVTILPFQPENQAEVKDLILAGLAEHWGTLDLTLNPDLDNIASTYANATFLVAWYQGEIVGSGALVPRSNQIAEIVRMSVAAKMRRQHIGRQILEQLVQHARDTGCSKVILETTATWHEVIEFYLRFGFHVTHSQDGDVYFELDLARVCSPDFAFHVLLNPQEGLIASILNSGLRPLSDFPDSQRWQTIQAHLPGIFEQLYNELAYPIIQKPYLNSGVFVSPIDFRHLPDSFMYRKTRIKIPMARIDPNFASLTYILNDRRVTLRLTRENLQATSSLWSATMIREWFARDQSRMFYFVPQIAIYQPGGIYIEPSDIED
jgi:putative acetyltransferase